MNWISVAERLPETTAEQQMVIVATDQGVGVADYNKINGFNNVSLNGRTQHMRQNITHWMPFPQHPES